MKGPLEDTFPVRRDVELSKSAIKNQDSPNIKGTGIWLCFKSILPAQIQTTESCICAASR